MKKGFQLILLPVIFTLIATLGLSGSLHAQISVIGGLRRHIKVAPGAEVQGQVIVRNSPEKAQTVKVYLTDYHVSADGSTVYGDPKKNPRSNGGWIHLVPQQQEIAPGGTASFNYIIRVPDNLSLSGTYWSMLMVEPVAPETLAPPKKKDKDKAYFSVSTVTRTGIHLVTHVGDTCRRDLKLTGQELKQEYGHDHNILQLDLENTGECYLRLTVWAELFDSQGVSVGRYDIGKKGLYPANSARLRIDLTGVPAGPYQVLVVADNGDEHVFGARYDLEIPK